MPARSPQGEVPSRGLPSLIPGPYTSEVKANPHLEERSFFLHCALRYARHLVEDDLFKGPILFSLNPTTGLFGVGVLTGMGKERFTRCLAREVAQGCDEILFAARIPKDRQRLVAIYITHSKERLYHAREIPERVGRTLDRWKGMTLKDSALCTLLKTAFKKAARQRNHGRN